MGEKRICPTCKGTAAVLLADSYMVRCVTCGEERHCTHWKTPGVHEERERYVQQLIREMEWLTPTNSKP